MSKAKMMYAFDHIPALVSATGGILATSYIGDYPFTPIPFSNGGAAGSCGVYQDTGGTWLAAFASGGVYNSANYYSTMAGISMPASLFDLTKPRSWIGFRFKPTLWAAGSNFAPLAAKTAGNAALRASLFNWADKSLTANQEYYVEIMIDNVNLTRSMWIDGALVINAQAIPAALQATDILVFGYGAVAVNSGSSGPQSAGYYLFKDMYIADDPNDGSFTRLGPIIAKPITVASATGAGTSTVDSTLNGSAIISSATAKFGSSSLTMGATTASGLVQGDQTVIRAGTTGDYTLEFWFNPTNITQTGCLIGKDAGVTPFAQIVFKAGALNFYPDNAASQISPSPSPAIVAGTWYHLAVVRASNVWTLYLNGVGLGTCTGGTFMNNNNFFVVGNNTLLNSPFAGYIDEVRISNVARYTQPFTPAAAAFTPDANTMALYHMDSSNNGVVPNAAASVANILNAPMSTNSPNVPNVASAQDGTTPLVMPLASTADAGAVVQGVLLVGAGQRNQGTGSVLRTTLKDQASPPNQQALADVSFPAGAFQYGKVLAFLPNALDGSGWNTAKVNQLSASLLVQAS